MGASASAEIDRRELDDYVRSTRFTEEEIGVLYVHFKNISATVRDDGLIDKKEFQAATGFKNTMYLDRVFRLFDDNNDGVINFKEFLMGLSVLSTRGTQEEKLAFSFKLYDQDCDNRISKAELTQMLMATLVESDLTLTPDQARRLVDRTMDAARTSEPGYVNLDEYRRLIEGSPGLMNDMTLNVHARIREEIANAKRDRAGK